jgi:hypothetical protein
VNSKKYIILSLVSVLVSLILVSCSITDAIQSKIGNKNKDFEYIKQNKVDKIVIQSTRDTGFRFVVTDKSTISEIYDLLSSAKAVSEKSSLDPDYIFEMQMGKDIKKFNYVVGIYDKKTGNFYDDKSTYVVPKRLDNDIIQNLSFIRKPREFEHVYYQSIIDVMKKDKDKIIQGGSNVGVDISEDRDCAQYILSTDLEQFKRDIKAVVPKGELAIKDTDKYDTLISVKNQGYKTTTFKTIVTITSKKDNSQTNYYVDAKYDDFNAWQISVLDKKPDSW